VAKYGTSYNVILPHNTKPKRFVIGFVFIPILRILSRAVRRVKCYNKLCRIVNTSHQRHYPYMLIYAFCSGVVKDHEAPFNLNYVHLKNY